MNRRIVFSTTGRIFCIISLLLLVPSIVAIIYKETSQLFAFLITAACSLALGLLILLITRTKNRVIYAKEGFAITALAWIAMSVVGAVPFKLSGDIPSYVDAVFETVSGFTTTGASILTDVEAMSRSMLFWRSFSHWIGGMGVLVFVMAIMPNIADRSIHIMRAEMPGPVIGKLVPRVKDTAKILYLIYIVLTIVEALFLVFGGMPVYDSLLHAFGTAGTGGFGIKGDSLASYSPYCQWIISIFMLIFGVNFNLYYLLLIKRFKPVLKSTELWSYVGIFGVSTILITANILPIYDRISDALRDSIFQVASIVTTTGYATADFNNWPAFSKGIIFVLLFSGACAGSTAGGFKIARTVMMIKNIRREFKKLLHPRSVATIHFEGKAVEEETIKGINTYFSIYMFCILAIYILISFEGFGFETNFTAVVSCFNNVGPGFGAVGPAGSYAAYTDFSKILLSFAMLLGRLEIFPLLIALSPSNWFKK